MFEEFTKIIENHLHGKLPGATAQYKMAPSERVPVKQYSQKKNNLKQSAVLFLLYPHKGKVHTAFILRPAHEGNHGGQVAFPGGKFEAGDLTLENTALRETEEEIGVRAKDVKMLGRLTKLYIPVSHFWVHPFVGVLNAKPEFVIDPNEVEVIIETEFDSLLNGRNIKEKKVMSRYLNREITAPCFDINGYTIWGATAMIISEMKELLLCKK